MPNDLDAVEPVPVSTVPASIPSAANDELISIADASDIDLEVEAAAESAMRLGQRYSAIQAADYGCQMFVCTFPHDGNCDCFNRALAQHVAQAIEARRAATLGAVHESAVGETDAPNPPPIHQQDRSDDN